MIKEELKEYKKKYSCVQCAYCCNKALCQYGRLNKDKNKCDFLEIDDEKLGTYRCLIYREIKEVEKNSPYPTFDHYCSSPLFNDVRNKVINKLKK